MNRYIPTGSLVQTQNKLKYIEDISPGDMVLTTVGYRRVENIYNQGDQEIVKIITKQGCFYCSSNHKIATKNFMSRDVIYKIADQLNSQDYLLSLRESGKFDINELNMEQVIDVIPAEACDTLCTWHIDLSEVNDFFCNTDLT